MDGDNAENASLVVETNIARAEVYIDSIYQGLTPLTITGIAPGLRRVEIVKDGYYRTARTVRITRGKKTTLYSELRADNGRTFGHRDAGRHAAGN